jgi:hypothetical protein
MIALAAVRGCAVSSFVRWFKLRVEDVMWKGATVGGGFFSAGCLCGKRRATQGATGGKC